MKHLLLTTIAAVVLVGCGPSMSIHDAAAVGDIEAVKQHIAAGADVNAKDDKIVGYPLHFAAAFGHKEIAEMLIANGADVNAKIEITELFIALGAGVNAKDVDGETPLDWAIRGSTKAMPESAHPRHHPEIATLLRKHGGKTGEELKAEGK